MASKIDTKEKVLDSNSQEENSLNKLKKEILY